MEDANEALREDVNKALRFLLWSFVPLVLIGLISLFLDGTRQSFFLNSLAIVALLYALALLIAGFIGLFFRPSRAKGVIALLLVPVAGVVSIVLGFAAGGGGGGWGRPLRVKGRQLHPDLREGSDWTLGDRPDVSQLDEATRKALEALWLHDAQKEHASVPAFSRISWMLAAVGAPAELMEWAHRAALEEIAHTRLCFALAAGYGGTSHSVEPMPDLLLGGLDLKGDPIEVLASESVLDGCQLEEFNADVAAECAARCEEPATRAVLEQIAREERSHAEFSWALLDWLFDRYADKVSAVIERDLAGLGRLRRPTAVSLDKTFLVKRADPDLLLKHGRIPDEAWGELWAARLEKTRARLLSMTRHAELSSPGSALKVGNANG